MCNKYNGYDNYPTWCYNLWQDNDEGNYHYIRELVNEVKEECELDYDTNPYNDIFTLEQNINYKLQEALKDNFEENNPLINEASVYSDLLGWAVSNINWHEIAEYLIEELKENDSI